MEKSERVKVDKERLYKAIYDKGLTPADVSTLCGYNRNWVSQLMSEPVNGMTYTRKARLIARVIGVDLSEILEASEAETVRDLEEVRENIVTIRKYINEMSEELDRRYCATDQALKALIDRIEEMKGGAE